MPFVIHLAWIVVSLLRYGGIAAIYAGVALFGIFFIRGNARSKDNLVPASSWRGAGPRTGMKIVLAGAAMLSCAYAVQLLLPDGT